MASDACTGVDDTTPSAPYVWFDVLPVGGRELGDDYFEYTVGVGATTVTIVTDDSALLNRIVDSVRPVEGCRKRLPTAPLVDSMLVEGLRDPHSAEVCAYRPAEDGSYDLVYATTLGEREAATYHAQVYDGGLESAPEFCGEGVGERVVVTITGDDPYGGDEISQETVVDPGCREVQGSPGWCPRSATRAWLPGRRVACR
jgi:hypothetical protein